MPSLLDLLRELQGALEAEAPKDTQGPSRVPSLFVDVSRYAVRSEGVSVIIIH